MSRTRSCIAGCGRPGLSDVASFEILGSSVKNIMSKTAEMH